MFRMELFYLFCFVMLFLHLKGQDDPKTVFVRLWKPYLAVCAGWFLLTVLLGLLPLGPSSVNDVTTALYERLRETFWVTQVSAFSGEWTGHTLLSLFPAVFFTWWEARLLKTLVKSPPAQAGFAVLAGVLSYVSTSFFLLPYALQDSLMLLPLWIMLGMLADRPHIPIRWDALFLLIMILPVFRVWIPATWMIFGNTAMWIWRAAVAFLILDSWKKAADWDLTAWFVDHSVLLLCAIAGAMGCYAVFGSFSPWQLHERESALGILIQVGLAALLLLAVLGFRRMKARFGYGRQKEEPGRDARVDFFRGVLMILVIAGHFMMNRRFWNVIYSFHMVAFVMISGYFYKKDERSIGKQILHLARTLLVPYLVCAVLYILLDLKTVRYAGLWPDLRIFLLGLSFATSLFNGVPQAGPIYFVLMLFLVRLIYLLLDRFVQNDKMRIAAVALLSMAGYLIGQRQYWLPWSFDLALYLLAVYEAGVQIRKYRLLRTLRHHPLWLLMLAALWAFMISYGSMEIATRKLSPYTLVLAGAVSGTCVVYLLCCGLMRELPGWMLKTVSLLGRYSVWVLVLHTLLRERVTLLAAKWVPSDGFLWFVISVAIQVAAGIILTYGLSAVKKGRRARSAK